MQSLTIKISLECGKLFGEFNILNFHPIHIYLNSRNFLQYNNLLKELSNKKTLFSKKKY